MATITVTAMIHSDQLAVVDDLPTDWLECQSEKQDDRRNCGPEWSQEEDLLDVGVSEMSEKKELSLSHQEGDDTEWSEEEDSGWSDEEDSEMSPENKALWESFLNNSDPFHPLYFIGTTEEKVSDSEDKDEEGEHALSSQEKDNIEWREEEDSVWSDEDQDGLEMSPENKALWESFLYNSDPFHPLYFSCPPGDKIKTSESPQNHTPSSPTVREGEDYTPEQSTERSAKKVRFSEEVTVHIFYKSDLKSQAVQDEPCWLKIVRDRDCFKYRVGKVRKLKQHKTTVLDRVLGCFSEEETVNPPDAWDSESQEAQDGSWAPVRRKRKGRRTNLSMDKIEN